MWFYLLTWFLFMKAWPGTEASWYWNKTSLESSKEAKWNKGDANAVHLLIRLNWFFFLTGWKHLSKEQSPEKRKKEKKDKIWV